MGNNNIIDIILYNHNLSTPILPLSNPSLRITSISDSFGFDFDFDLLSSFFFFFVFLWSFTKYYLFVFSILVFFPEGLFKCSLEDGLEAVFVGEFLFAWNFCVIYELFYTFFFLPRFLKKP